jgi:ribosomal protein L30/L7E
MTTLVIRISGMIKIPNTMKEALFRMRLRRKYAAVLLEETEENRKLLLAVRNHVAYGKISPEEIKKLKELRGQGEKKFFRLHPPRGGIESKKHFGVGKGVLGDNKDKINKLLERML